MNKFNYENTETVVQKGGKVVRKVSIKKGRGHKSISKYRNGKKIYTVKKPIHKDHIVLIKKGKFIRGLFNDCKTKKRCKRGGTDIEMGRDSPTTYMSKVPPDPDRFKQYDMNAVRESFSPVPSSSVANVFSGPTPEQKTIMENRSMMEEDPHFHDPFYTEDLQIFKR